MLNVKPCMMKVPNERYLFIPPLLVTVVFQGHSSVRPFEQKFFVFLPIKLKLCMIVDCVK